MGSQYSRLGSEQRDLEWRGRKCVLQFEDTVRYLHSSKVAELRKEKGFSPLEVYVIDVISSTSANLSHHDAGWLKKTKLSSTWIREWIVNQSKQEEEEDE